MPTETTKPQVTIVHTRQHGTIVYGTVQNDGSGTVLHKYRFRGSQNLEVPWDEELGEPYWYMPHSQRSRADQYYIDLAAEGLRAAGWPVEIRIDDTTPAVGFWVLEQRKYDHAGYRADRLERRAGTATRTADSIREANRQTYETLNGTPVLIDHHSGTRHRNLLDRLWKREGKAFELIDTAGDLLGRAQAARDFQGRREAHGTTLRRIQKLEKRLRDIEKAINGQTAWWFTEPLTEGHPSELEDHTTRLTAAGIPFERTGRTDRGCVEVWVGISEHGKRVYAAEVVETVEEITYWEDLITASGQKVWRAEDFTKGDFVQISKRWLEVLKVSKKSLTVPDRFEDRDTEIQTAAGLACRVRHPNTSTVTYDVVTGKLTAEQAREAFPEEFSPLLEGEPLPKRPSAKRGKVAIDGGGGANAVNWWFTIDGQRFHATWLEPEHAIWYGPPTPVADPEPIKVFKTFGMTSKPAELVTEVSVPPGIRWIEEVFNLLRAWAEPYAQQQTTEPHRPAAVR